MRTPPKYLSELRQNPRRRIRTLLERGRRKLHRASYWRVQAKSYPILGVTPEELERRITAAVAPRPDFPSYLSLTGLRLHEGLPMYWGFPLPGLRAEIIDALRVLTNGGVPNAIGMLLKEGWAVESGPNPETDRVSSLIISPHHDDAALSLGGFMCTNRVQACHVVCNVFTTSSWLGDGFPSGTLSNVTNLRRAEERLSNRVLGARSIALGLWEADIRIFHRRSIDNYPDREGFTFADDPDLRSQGEADSVRQSVMTLVERLRPEKIGLPLGLGGHMDHVFLREQGIGWLDELGRRFPGTRVFFYEDMPYATYEDIDAATVADGLGSQVKLESEVVPLAQYMETKVQSVAAYRSQFHRADNEERLRDYAAQVAIDAGLPSGSFAERIWNVVG